MDDIQFDGFDEYRTDPDLESGEGVRIEYEDGKAIVIRRAGGRNVAYNQALAKKMGLLGKKKPTPEEDRRIMAEIYAETIVVGWHGITAGGKDVPFTKANVTRFLTSFPDLFQDIANHASRIDAFLVQSVEDAEKN